MSQTGEKVKITIHETDFEIVLFEEKGKVFAKAYINNFGEIIVPDLGGGKDRALRNIQAHIANILAALQNDLDREAKKQQRQQEQEAKKQQQQVQNN
jgi:hypothetical protein